MKTTGKILASNSAWSLLNQGARVGTLAVVTIALSRHFGPQSFGALIIGLSSVRIFAVIATFGLDRIVVRQLTESSAGSAYILRSVFRLKLRIAAGTYVTLLGFVFCFDSGNRLLLQIAAIAGAGLLFQPWDVYDYFFQAVSQFGLTTLGRTLPILFCSAVKLAAVAAGAPLLCFAALETLEMALIAFGLGIVYRLRVSHTPRFLEPRWVNLRCLLQQGFPLLLGSLAAMVYMRSDVLILGKLAGDRVAGLYAAAAQISEACALLPVAFLPALLPVLMHWRKRGPISYGQQFEKLFLAAFVTGGLVAVGLTISAPIIVPLLYGESYLPAASILVIHAWSAIFLFSSIIQTGYEVTEGLTWLTAARTTVGAIVNVALNFGLIPRFGAAGSAYATLIAFACSSLLCNLLFRQSRSILFLQMRALLVPIGHKMTRARWNIPPTQLANSGNVAR